jgi:hypothetical protein
VWQDGGTIVAVKPQEAFRRRAGRASAACSRGDLDGAPPLDGGTRRGFALLRIAYIGAAAASSLPRRTGGSAD